MGALEQTAKRKRRWGAFQKGMLAAVAIGGVVVAAGIMPNAARLLKYFPGYKKGARFNYRSKTVLNRLTEKGHIVWERKGNTKVARLTEKGERALDAEIERISAGKKRRWDGRWRVVAFDIPTSRNGTRARLRRLVHELGFVRLQNSVWIYPYDCEDLIALAKADFRLGANVLYLIVEELENDTALRKHFGLPLE